MSKIKNFKSSGNFQQNPNELSGIDLSNLKLVAELKSKIEEYLKKTGKKICWAQIVPFSNTPPILTFVLYENDISELKEKNSYEVLLTLMSITTQTKHGIAMLPIVQWNNEESVEKNISILKCNDCLITIDNDKDKIESHYKTIAEILSNINEFMQV